MHRLVSEKWPSMGAGAPGRPVEQDLKLRVFRDPAGLLSVARTTVGIEPHNYPPGRTLSYLLRHYYSVPNFCHILSSAYHLIMDSTSNTGTLDPLPSVLQHGLIAVSSFGLISLMSSTALLLYLSYKLFSWWWRGDLDNGCNQFLLLIYNLVLADIQQSLAFSVTLVWLGENKIDAHSTTCFVEGWFVSTGDLASGVWIFAIALHTFYAVIKGRRIPTPVFTAFVGGLWFFIYAVAVTGVALHPHNYYVRAGAWCWINEEYGKERLWLHYFWIFICMFGTIWVYFLIYIALRSRVLVQPLESNSSLAPLSTRGNDKSTLQRAGRYMVLYPVVYTICTLPLAAGRMAAMTGVIVPYAYYCLAGAAITSCGWLDVILYACTRRVLVLSDKPPAPENMGADTFGVFNWSSNSISMLTTIEGGLGTPVRGHKRQGILSTLHANRRTPTASAPRDEMFATPIAGVITTKTTIEITNRPVTQDGHVDHATATGGSSATSRFEFGKGSEPSRHTSWAGSWHNDADTTSQR